MNPEQEQKILAAIERYGSAVADATVAANFNRGTGAYTNKERMAIIALCRLVLGRRPTEPEIEKILGC